MLKELWFQIKFISEWLCIFIVHPVKTIKFFKGFCRELVSYENFVNRHGYNVNEDFLNKMYLKHILVAYK